MQDPFGRVLKVGWLSLLIAGICLSQLSGCRKKEPANPASQTMVEKELRAIQSAQNAYLSSHDHYACTMGELGSQFGLIDHQLSYGHKDGYSYSIECSVNINPSYQVWATPTETGLISPPSFCVDHTGQMRRASHRMDSCQEAHSLE